MNELPPSDSSSSDSAREHSGAAWGLPISDDSRLAESGDVGSSVGSAGSSQGSSQEGSQGSSREVRKRIGTIVEMINAETISAPVTSPELLVSTVEAGMDNGAAAAPQAAPSGFPGSLERGTKLGHFEIVKYIGGGGMGRVYLARDTALDRKVAIKVLPRQRAHDQGVVARFMNEARSAARLNHEHIAQVYFAGEHNGMPFIAFEYVEGTNIRALVEEYGLFPIPQAVNFLIQITHALAHAHAHGVVHRDVKPSNILITKEGRAKLIDMGLARLLNPSESRDDLTASGVTLGTFDYISPEQARDPRIADIRSDIYSLGCTLFYMLTGQPPFPEGTVLQKLLQHQGDLPPDVREFQPDIPAEVAQLIQKMMAKDPRQRFQTPAALLGSLVAIAEMLGLKPTGPGRVIWVMRPTQQRSRFLKHLPWAMSVALLLLIVFGLQFSWRHQKNLSVPDFSPYLLTDEPHGLLGSEGPDGTKNEWNSSRSTGSGLPGADWPVPHPGGTESHAPVVFASDAESAEAGWGRLLAGYLGAYTGNFSISPGGYAGVSSRHSFTGPGRLPSDVAGQLSVISSLATRQGGDLPEEADAARHGPARDTLHGMILCIKPAAYELNAFFSKSGKDEPVRRAITPISLSASLTDIDSGTASSPSLVPKIYTVDPSGHTPHSYRSLGAVLTALGSLADPSSPVRIELRSNQAIPTPPLTLTGRRLHITAANGFTPTLLFSAGEGGGTFSERSMLTLAAGAPNTGGMNVGGSGSGIAGTDTSKPGMAVSGGSSSAEPGSAELTFSDIAFDFAVPQEISASRWTFFEIPDAAKLSLERCVLTIRNSAIYSTGIPSTYHQEVAFFRCIAPPLGLNPSNSGTSSTVAPIEIRLKDIVVRGEAAILHTEVERNIDFSIENGFVASSKPLVSIDTPKKLEEGRFRMRLALDHATVFLHAPLIRQVRASAGNAPLPLVVDLSNSILALNRNPLIDFRGIGTLDKNANTLRWSENAAVFYQDVPFAWVLKPLTGTEMYREMGWDEWNEIMNTTAKRDLVAFERPLHTQVKPVSRMVPSEFPIRQDPTNPAYRIAAGPAGAPQRDAGQNIAPLPKVADEY